MQSEYESLPDKGKVVNFLKMVELTLKNMNKIVHQIHSETIRNSLLGLNEEKQVLSAELKQTLNQKEWHNLHSLNNRIESFLKSVFMSETFRVYSEQRSRSEVLLEMQGEDPVEVLVSLEVKEKADSYFSEIESKKNMYLIKKVKQMESKFNQECENKL